MFHVYVWNDGESWIAHAATFSTIEEVRAWEAGNAACADQFACDSHCYGSYEDYCEHIDEYEGKLTKQPRPEPATC